MWLADCRAAFASLTHEKQREANARKASAQARAAVQPDDLIDFQVRAAGAARRQGVTFMVT